MKRAFDFVIASLALVFFSPLLLTAMFFVYLQDFRSPFYIASRVGKGGVLFPMVKLRSMVVGADKSGVDSTSNQDARITTVGKLVRAYKLDELTQLWNVFKGDMSLVGPRPNVKRETDLYTAEERKLISVRPGITDFASIIFSDEGDILSDQKDPDIAYNQLIRPGKSRLGIFYIENRSLWVDLKILALTAVAIVSRPIALQGVCRLLESMGASLELIEIARREIPLVPMPPPGSDLIVTSRSLA